MELKRKNMGRFFNLMLCWSQGKFLYRLRERSSFYHRTRFGYMCDCLYFDEVDLRACNIFRRDGYASWRCRIYWLSDCQGVAHQRPVQHQVHGS